MKTITKTRERESVQKTTPPLVHRYPGKDQTPEGPGSVALCGHVLRRRWTVAPGDTTTRKLTCVVCADLSRSLAS